MRTPSIETSDYQTVQIQARINDESSRISSEIVFNAQVDSQLIQNSPFSEARRWVAMAYTAAAIGVHRQLVGSWMPHANSNTVLEISQSQPQMYNHLENAINELALLDEEESRAIDEDAQREGIRILKLMGLTNVPPPTIFSHGGDSLVFTWEIGNTKRYLTPLEGIARLREYEKGKPGQPTSSIDFDLANQMHMVRLLKYVGGSEWATARTE